MLRPSVLSFIRSPPGTKAGQTEQGTMLRIFLNVKATWVNLFVIIFCSEHNGINMQVRFRKGINEETTTGKSNLIASEHM